MPKTIESLLHFPQAGKLLTQAIVDEEKALYSKSLLRQALLNVVTSANVIVVGRKSELMLCVAAILARQNVMLFGDPGEGKTFLADTLLDFFHEDGEFGADIFRTQLCSEMSVEPILGGVPVQNIMDGNSARNIENRLPTANFALLDEFGKCPSTAISGLMGILNEKRFFDGDKFVSCPILTAFAVTNEADWDLAGLSSRFLLKLTIDALEGPDFLTVCERKANAHLRSYDVLPQYKLNMRQLYWAQISAAKMGVEPDVLVHLKEFRDYCRNSGIKVDTRQGSNCVPFLKAYAWLVGSKTVTARTLKVLPYLYPNEPTDAAAVKDLWGKYTSAVSLGSSSAPEPESAIDSFLVGI